MARDNDPLGDLENEDKVYGAVQRQMYTDNPKLAEFVDRLFFAISCSSRVRGRGRGPVAAYFVRDHGIRMEQ